MGRRPARRAIQSRHESMKYALIADIHANLPALDAVLDDVDHRAPDAATYHLGDLVGYAPWPNEVVELLQRRGIPGVAGNYDSTVAADYKHCGCQYEDPRQEALSHLSYGWTREHTRVPTKRVLGALPFRIDLRPRGGHASGPRLILVHGTPSLNTVYWTEDRPDSFSLKMARIVDAGAGDVIAFGHTHKPWHREIAGIHFVNAGSVGRPKDGDWRTGYVLVDFAATPGPSVEFVRCAYDIAGAMEKIRQSDLPDEFATILQTGGSLTTPASRRA